jgi:hypothetical protein
MSDTTVCTMCSNTGRAYRTVFKLYEVCNHCSVADAEMAAFIKATEDEAKSRLEKKANEIREQRKKQGIASKA